MVGSGLFFRQVIFVHDYIHALLGRLYHNDLKLTAAHFVEQILHSRKSPVPEVKAYLEQAVPEPLMLSEIGQSGYCVKGVAFPLTEVLQDRFCCLSRGHCRRGAPF